MRTIEVTAYTAEELKESHPGGYERARAAFQVSMWESGYPYELIREDQHEAERELRSPFAGRFIEWSLCPPYARYDSGPLTSEEMQRLVGLFPVLEGATVWLEGNDLHADLIDTADEDAATIALEEANIMLDIIVRRLYLCASAVDEDLSSDDAFIAHAEANEYEYTADGRMV